MGAINLQMAYDPGLTLPGAFVDRYMTECTPVYALIYIYGLRNSGNLSTKHMAEIFHVLESDVLSAWRYWEALGLVALEESAGTLSVVYKPVPAEPARAEPSAGKTPEPKPEKIFLMETRPQYTPEELAYFPTQSADIAGLFKQAEQSLGKMLTYHDLNVLFGFYDWLRLPVPVIRYLLQYCEAHGHRDLRYIEKAALDWAERDIQTVEAAEAYVQTFDRDYRSIMKALGQPSAFPSPTQRKYIGKWLNEFLMPVALIEEACDRCAAQIGKPKLTYVDKIIAAWHKKGLRTLDAVSEEAEAWQKQAQAKSKAAAEKMTEKSADKAPRRNRFANFKPRERDFEQIERLEREYLLKTLEGR